MTELQSCDCTEDLGPCEDHCTVMVSREGASLRTADELSALFVHDARSNGVELSPWGRDVLERVDAALAANESMGVAWLPVTDEGEALHNELQTLTQQVETELYTLGIHAYWEDGYRLLKITGGPFKEDN